MENVKKCAYVMVNHNKMVQAKIKCYDKVLRMYIQEKIANDWVDCLWRTGFSN